MPTRLHRSLSLSIASLAITLVPTSALRAQPCDLAVAESLAAGVVTTNPLIDGTALWVEDPALQLATESYAGTYDSTTQIPIASASKLLSAIAILTLVDDDLINLDEPVSTYLPQFTGAKGTITVRQCFAHTSGLPGSSPVLGNLGLTLEQATNTIACCVPLSSTPGTQFVYGGVSMHVAGRVAEVVTGQSWRALFDDRVAVPLGMTQTDYDGLGVTENARIAGGARSSLPDYANALRMLRDGGTFNGVQVLSAASVEAMFSDQTGGVPIVSAPASVPPGTRYGVGVWLDRVEPDGRVTRISSPGAFGFTPWIELDYGYAGLFMVQNSFAALAPEITTIQDEVREVPPGCIETVLTFVRGDTTGDGQLSLADAIESLDVLFGGGDPGPCPDIVDTTSNGTLELADVILLLNALFSGVPVPTLDGVCRVDLIVDGFPCLDYDSCP